MQLDGAQQTTQNSDSRATCCFQLKMKTDSYGVQCWGGGGGGGGGVLDNAVGVILGGNKVISIRSQTLVRRVEERS